MTKDKLIELAQVGMGIHSPNQPEYIVCEALIKALAQPEQEPVAWIHNHIKGNIIAHRPATLDRHPDHWTALYPEPKPCQTCEALARTVMMDQTGRDA